MSLFQGPAELFHLENAHVGIVLWNRSWSRITPEHATDNDKVTSEHW